MKRPTKQDHDIFLSRYFSVRALPYWCVGVLDCITIILLGVLGVYLVNGGELLVFYFWDYFYIWMLASPIFIISMVLFRTYGGLSSRTLKENIIRVACALALGGIIVLALFQIAPTSMLPLHPSWQAVVVTVLMSGVLQICYRWIFKKMHPEQLKQEVKSWMAGHIDDDGHYHSNMLMPKKKINLCLAHMSEDGMEEKYVQEAFDTNWVVPLGPNVNAFEQDLEQYVSDEGHEPKVAALSAGTAAVHLALLGCGVRHGDEVIVQSFTFCASCNPITYLGATPVFVDSEPSTWNMDPDLLETAIKSRIAKTGNKPKAIVTVALYGMPYDCTRIMEIANRYDIPVIEDAAEGFGSRYKGQVLGTFGRYGVLSFNGNKMITTSGGGALICNGSKNASPADLKNNILWYATQARESYPYYQHEAIGYNYRMSNVCAGIGRGQMTVLEDHLAHHKHVQQMYVELLKDVKGITVHCAPNADYDANYWLCAITLDPSLRVKGQENAYKKVVAGAVGGAAGVVHTVDAPTTDCQPNTNVEAMRVYLDNAQIEARPVWKPMHKQPVYKDAPAYVNGVSEAIFKVGLCLPAGPYVGDNEVNYIVSRIKEAIIA